MFWLFNYANRSKQQKLLRLALNNNKKLLNNQNKRETAQ
jgi:hypothetical protein